MHDDQKSVIKNMPWTGSTKNLLNPLDALPADAKVTIDEVALQLATALVDPTGETFDSSVVKLAAAAMVIGKIDGNQTPAGIVALLERARDAFVKSCGLE